MIGNDCDHQFTQKVTDWHLEACQFRNRKISVPRFDLNLYIHRTNLLLDFKLSSVHSKCTSKCQDKHVAGM